MWTLSGFADEISPDLEEQCRVLGDLGMTHLEFRSAWGTNVSDLDADQLARAADTLAGHGITVTCIGSPIGKIRADGDFEEHRARLGRCLVAAQALGAPYVRVFSFFTDSPDRDRDEVLRRMGALAQDAGAAGVVLVHENESGTFGNHPRRCLDLVESVGSPALRLTWDPANFVAEGVRPFDDAYPVLRPHVEYLQIKDKVAATGTVVAAGGGDGQILQTLTALREDGFDGVFSLEPHLGHAVGGAPFSGPELFAQAHAAFTDLLRQAGATFS